MNVRIERLGHRGDGIAGGPVFVPRTLPGELVDGLTVDGRMDQVRILEPSADRVKPACPHYAACGGCSLQHASDGFVDHWKTDVVRTALAVLGIETDIRPIHTSPPRSRRRATLAGRRTKKGALVGFHARTSDQITPVPNCTLLDPDITACLPQLETLVRLGASRSAALRLQVTVSEGGLDISVTGGKTLDRILREQLADWCGHANPARLTWSGELVAQLKKPVQRFGPASLTPPPGAFLQATTDGQARLVEDVLEVLDGAGRCVDLFSGCGTFALPIAQGIPVHAIEGDAAMLAALDAGWRMAEGLKQITTEKRDLFRRPMTIDELNKFDAVCIDPPRAGADAQCRELADSAVRRIAFVSCNPTTFARDVKTLIDGGFVLDWVRPVDQFRWSAHVELAARLTRRHMAR